MTEASVTVEDIEAAARRLDGVIVRTPLLESPLLNERLGGRLLVKAECLQRTGSFKIRGAYNRIAQIPEARRKDGIVAYSSGNHAQGVAAAARLLGAPAVIVMPADAPALKIANTRALGGEVVLYDRLRESREAIGARIAAERGSIVVPPYDDPDVIAGQGTIGLEVAAQAAELGAAPDAILIPCSGGGLASGIATAVAARLPRIEAYTVEPAGFDDMARSLASGARVSNPPLGSGATSFCDALLVQTPGEITFPIARRLMAGGFAVDDAAVARAMAAAFESFKIVVEPGGAVALAAVLEGLTEMKGRTVVAVCSGGNVDAATFAAALKRA
ncbi:MAG TPA: threonine/serine dehydratase [Alphaproteobacteria bacterium]|jgi:threonine dehydratase